MKIELKRNLLLMLAVFLFAIILAHTVAQGNGSEPKQIITTRGAVRALSDLEKKGLLFQAFEEATFLSKLEFTLEHGVAAKDKHATAACFALLFSDDTKVVRRAGQVALTAHNLIGRTILDNSLIKIAKDRNAMKSKAAPWRLGILLGLAGRMNDGYSYIDVLVAHIGSGSRTCTALAINDLYPIRETLLGAFEANEYPPRLPVVGKEPKQLTVTLTRKLQADWKKWLSTADRKKVNRAMKSWFDAKRPVAPGE